MPRVLPESSRLRSSVPVRKRRRALRKATPIPEGGLRRFPNHPALLRLFAARFHFFVSVSPAHSTLRSPASGHFLLFFLPSPFASDPP